MYAWKSLLVVAVIAAGFGTGYWWKNSNQAATPQAAVDRPQTALEPLPPGYDPDLILPPPDNRGVVLNLPVSEIRDHFKNAAGLTEPIVAPSWPTVEEFIPVAPRQLPEVLRLPELPFDLVEPVEARQIVETLPMPRELP